MAQKRRRSCIFNLSLRTRRLFRACAHSAGTKQRARTRCIQLHLTGTIYIVGSARPNASIVIRCVAGAWYCANFSIALVSASTAISFALLIARYERRPVWSTMYSTRGNGLRKGSTLTATTGTDRLKFMDLGQFSSFSQQGETFIIPNHVGFSHGMFTYIYLTTLLHLCTHVFYKLVLSDWER